MNEIKEMNNINLMKEIKSEIYDSYYAGDFFCIWKKIVSTFKFVKKPKILDEDLLSELAFPVAKYNFYNEYDKTKYKNVDKEEIVIYSDDNEIITTTAKNTYGIYNLIYAVRDMGKQSNRFFIGIVLEGEIINNTILGLIVYFNKEGNVFEKKILNKSVFDYDIRNGSYNTFFCNQSLIFTQRDRNTSKLMIGLNLLSFEDSLTHTSSNYTEINNNYSNKYKLINNRFINIEFNNESTLIDLISLKKVEREDEENYGYYGMFKNKATKRNYLIIETYLINDSSNIDNFIKDFNKEGEEFDEDYPINCINCGSLTSLACISYYYSYMNLGKSYCHDCKIRYSKSENRWVCCQMSCKEYVCQAPLNKDNKCCKEEHSKDEIKIVRSLENPGKYPYKKNIELTI